MSCATTLKFALPLLALSMGAPAPVCAQTLPTFQVGRNLQASGSIVFASPAPEGGIELTITSEEPDRLRFSADMTKAGSPSIVLRSRAGMRESPEFWAQALDDEGTVRYTVTSQALGTLTGEVRLSPSAIHVMGPLRIPTFRTTPRQTPSRITLYAVRLDSSLKFEEQQLVAGGMRFELELTSSDPGVGTLNPAEVVLEGGGSLAVADFVPAGLGSATLSITIPPGFSRPAEHAEVTAVVAVPGIALTKDLTIGENLQVRGIVGLGEPAPPGGVTVTLTSEDPERLILSRSDVEVGSRQLEVKIPEGQVSVPVWLQSLAKTGTTSYSASAEGYQQRTETVAFAPSGVVVMSRPYGPPDEAELLRPHAGSITGGVWASLSKGDRLPLCLWMVQLDPTTLRGADITVQPLRAGAKLEVKLQISDPGVGKVPPLVVISPGQERAALDFIPTAVGRTTISVITPAGYTQAANSTAITATVTE